MVPRTCVSPEGRFLVGVHNPGFEVDNFRLNTRITSLGKLPDDSPVENRVNFPAGAVRADQTDRIYEIANAFPFRGSTFINSAWADRRAGAPEAIGLPEPEPCSLTGNIRAWQKETGQASAPPILDLLPRPMRLALAQASTDPAELAALARQSCTLLFGDNDDRNPTGLAFRNKGQGRPVPEIHDHDLYDILGNNPFLPDRYKEAMVLRPGIQGSSEIIGEACDGTHVFEYLRRNSYIPWGHFAANMANDEIRYRARDLTLPDMTGIRHLYYQRIYARAARQLDIPLPGENRPLSVEELESLRRDITGAIKDGRGSTLDFNSALWGWNFGFGFAQSGHRLHASHQMIHQQNAMVPDAVTDNLGNAYPCFSCGDLVTAFIREYRAVHNEDFFPAYLKAIRTNRRTDGSDDLPASLVVHEDEQVILFAPKAQVSEWELMLMTKAPCPHILDADTDLRAGLDRAMLTALQTLESLGARMVTGIELAGRFDGPDIGQHLVYSFIPRLPWAPDTFSGAQLRWISGCYPEDFALACRRVLEKEQK